MILLSLPCPQSDEAYVSSDPNRVEQSLLHGAYCTVRCKELQDGRSAPGKKERGGVAGLVAGGVGPWSKRWAGRANILGAGEGGGARGQ